MKIKIYHESVFTYLGKGGNKAGVVLIENEIDENEKLDIAKRLNYSETAFVKFKNKKNIQIEFYTPKCKIEFCGHACIGSFIRLFKEKKITCGTYKVKVDIGILSVIIEKNRVYLEQDEIKTFNVETNKKILKSLNINDSDLDERFKIKIGYSGLKDILIPIKTREKLNNLNVNLNLVEEVSKEEEVVGYHIYSFEKNDIYCRNFAPLYGINEESATGSSNGALLGYLYKNGFIEEGEQRVFQGENYGDISLIYGKILKENKIYIGSEF